MALNGGQKRSICLWPLFVNVNKVTQLITMKEKSNKLTRAFLRLCNVCACACVFKICAVKCHCHQMSSLLEFMEYVTIKGSK